LYPTLLDLGRNYWKKQPFDGHRLLSVNITLLNITFGVEYA